MTTPRISLVLGSTTTEDRCGNCPHLAATSRCVIWGWRLRIGGAARHPACQRAGALHAQTQRILALRAEQAAHWEQQATRPDRPEAWAAKIEAPWKEKLAAMHRRAQASEGATTQLAAARAANVRVMDVCNKRIARQRTQFRETIEKVRARLLPLHVRKPNSMRHLSIAWMIEDLIERVKVAEGQR